MLVEIRAELRRIQVLVERGARARVRAKSRAALSLDIGAQQHRAQPRRQPLGRAAKLRATGRNRAVPGRPTKKLHRKRLSWASRKSIAQRPKVILKRRRLLSI